MDGKTVAIQYQSEEDDSHRYRRRNENLMQTQSEPVSSTKTIKLIKQTPMNPTPLYVSLDLCRSSSDILCFHQRIFLVFNKSDCNSCLWICHLYLYSGGH